MLVPLMMDDLQFFHTPKQLKKLKWGITSRLELDDETIAPHTNVCLRFVLMSLRNGYVPTSRKAAQTTNLLKSTKMWVRKYLISPYLLWKSGFPRISPKQAVNNKQPTKNNKTNKSKTSWWFWNIFLFFTPTWGKDPFWLIIFDWVGSPTT